MGSGPVCRGRSTGTEGNIDKSCGPWPSFLASGTVAPGPRSASAGHSPFGLMEREDSPLASASTAAASPLAKNTVPGVAGGVQCCCYCFLEGFFFLFLFDTPMKVGNLSQSLPTRRDTGRSGIRPTITSYSPLWLSGPVRWRSLSHPCAYR